MALRIEEGERTVGVVDCLSIGFAKINGMLWVLLFPILLGLLLWRAPVLSASPALENMLAGYAGLLAADPAAALGDPSNDLAQAGDALGILFADLNLFSFLSLGVGIANRGSIPAGFGGGQAPALSLPPISSPVEALGLAIALELFGLLLGAAYLGLIAQHVRGEQIRPRYLARRICGYWLSLGGFLGLLCVAMVIVTVPIALVLALAFAFAAGIAGALLVAVVMGWQVILIWLTIYLFFVVDAAIVGELGPISAVKSSARVVGAKFWAAVGFIILYLVITYGMLVLWSQLGNEPWAIVVGIAGHGYVASGLAAASMVFYHTRSSMTVGRKPVRGKG